MRRPSLDAKALALACRRPQQVIVGILWKFWEGECPKRAAALTYTTLVSLVPFLAVAFAMLKGFGALESIETRVEELIFTHLVTTSSFEMTDYIRKFLEGIHAGTVGAVSMLAFIITAVLLLNAVASDLNRVWGAKERRSIKERFLTFFTFTILGPLLFGASLSITGTLGKSSVWTWWPMPGLGPLVALAIPFLFTWAGFLLLYWVIPSAPLRLRPALFGSLTAAVIWELVKIGFEFYVTRMVSYGKIYGSLSVVPVFLLWLYVSWLVALLGFQVAFFFQYPTALGRASERPVGHTAVPVPEAMRTFLAVAESFEKGGGPLSPEQVADRLGLPEETVVAILAELERRGYLVQVATPGGGYLPGLSPAAIRVAELWQALGGAAGAGRDPLGQVLAQAAETMTKSLGGTTVHDLLEARRA